MDAGMVEQVDSSDLGSDVTWRRGSNPLTGTTTRGGNAPNTWV